MTGFDDGFLARRCHLVFFVVLYYLQLKTKGVLKADEIRMGSFSTKARLP